MLAQLTCASGTTRGFWCLGYPNRATSAGGRARYPDAMRHGVQVREVGDGNINFVYIVEGPAGALCVKQGPPYVRIMQSWALTQVNIIPACTEANALPT